MTHRVDAQRYGEGARLRCSICKGSLEVVEFDVDAMNHFIKDHQPCMDFAR